MRLSGKLKANIIKFLSLSFIGDEAFILFGSRVDINKTGGDIDIAVKSNLSQDAFKKQKTLFLIKMLQAGLDIKIDLVQYHSGMDALLKKEIDVQGIILKN